MFKRILDITGAALLLMVSAPVLGVSALLIKFDSPGPVLFHQPRMGRAFQKFQVCKLRTMRHGTCGPAITLGEDPRITRVGRWLRWFKFDELPQLWNVVRGEMSLVGPRPVVPELALEFQSTYEHLLTVRPGLTDPATVKFCREAEFLSQFPDPMAHFKAVLTPEKLRLSAEYLEHANVWSDLGVLMDTVVALFPVHFHLPTGGLISWLRARRLGC